MGEWVGWGLRRFRVVIPYNEPTFTARLPNPPPGPYVAEYLVKANSKSGAKKTALAAFEATARASNVAWVRVPEKKGIKVYAWAEDEA